MGKRFICMLLALMLVLLCGCNGDSTQTTGNSEETISSESSVSSTEGSETTATQTTGTGTTEELVIPKVEDIAYQVPEYDGAPLLPYDPDRQIYIPFYNQNMDYYPDYWFAGIAGFVITKEHYAVEDIRVNVPAQTPHQVDIIEIRKPSDLPEGSTWSGSDKFWDYHYLCQQGIDWQEFGQLACDAAAADSILWYREHMSGSEISQCEAYLQAYNALEADYQAQYAAVAEETEAPFYIYDVSFRFTDIGAYEETVETIEFIFGEESYTVDIGQWRFHTERPAELTVGKSSVGLGQVKNVRAVLAGCPYNGGYEQLENILKFIVQKDLTVTGIRQLGVEVGVVGARVVVTGSTYADYYWDLQQPLEFQKGDFVSITLYLKDDRFAQYEAGITTYFVMDYEIKGKAYSICAPCLLSRINYYAWDVYLMAFEGYDIGEYYTCYYVPLKENWIQDLPEEWRE